MYLVLKVYHFQLGENLTLNYSHSKIYFIYMKTKQYM